MAQIKSKILISSHHFGHKKRPHTGCMRSARYELLAIIILQMPLLQELLQQEPLFQPLEPLLLELQP